MHWQKLLPTLLSLATSYTVTAQPMHRDTVYFDKEWSICEKPVAAYYRVTTLNRLINIFYTGPTRDYYITGEPEMAGQYDENGLEQGQFEFYDQKGKIIKQGTYHNGIMHGTWTYFDENENRIAEFNCNTGSDFTPILIVDKAGKTLVKDGDGMFVLCTKTDLPGVFPAQDFTIEGEVQSGRKQGVFRYYSMQPEKSLVFTERYENGSLIRGRPPGGSEGSGQPLQFEQLDLSPPNLRRIDNFYHGNIVFGYDKGAVQKVIDLLINNIPPEIPCKCSTFTDNTRPLFKILSNVIKAHVEVPVARDVFENVPVNDEECYLLALSVEPGKDDLPPSIDCNAVFTIDTAGYIISSAIEGNLPKPAIAQINYYLSRVSGLIPYQQENEKSLANIDIRIFTFIDTVNGNGMNGPVLYRYVGAIGNVADSIRQLVYSHRDTLPLKPQIEAKFPGGPGVWQKYLERNLNSQVAVEHGAPLGNYTVIVSFLVDQSGNISEVEALNNPGYGTAEEAVRVIQKGPSWTPAVMNGKNIVYRQKQSITFVVSVK